MGPAWAYILYVNECGAVECGGGFEMVGVKMNLFIVIFAYLYTFYSWLKELWMTTYLVKLTVERDANNRNRLVVSFGKEKAFTDYEECRRGQGFYFKNCYFSNKKADLCTKVITCDPDNDN